MVYSEPKIVQKNRLVVKKKNYTMPVQIIITKHMSQTKIIYNYISKLGLRIIHRV